MSDKLKKILKKFTSPNSKPTADTFPELVDCIVWLRFFLAIIFGVWIGYERESKNRGTANILFGWNFVAFLPILYCKFFLGADQDSYGNKLLFSGIIQGLALSMLIWFYFYTDSHTIDEAAFVSAFNKLLLTNADSDEGNSPMIENESTIVDDSEF